MRRSLLLCASVLTALHPLGAAAQTNAPGPGGWISAPELSTDKPHILYYRRAIALSGKPRAYRVKVTADNRFILFVNGKRVAAGPSTGDVAHWREESIDLAPWLRSGRNVISATVWNGVTKVAKENPFTSTAPAFQQSVATGFRLIGEGAAVDASTDQPGWRVKEDGGHSFANGWRQVKAWYYVAGNPEVIDAAKTTFDSNAPEERGDGWSDAVAAPDAAKRTLVADRLPQQRYTPTHVGTVVRTTLPALRAFPQRSVTVPAHTTAKLLLQRDVMTSAYPELDVSGGKGATIKVTWSEALYDAKRLKGDRDLIGDRNPIGIWDTFTADGQPRTFASLWWRTWRYVEIEVQTQDQPLTLQAMRAFETGYPFEQVGTFRSDDPQLDKIFDIGWRTAKLDAHETYMDTAYWEQLQYLGDTRLQMLISYAVSGDARLAEQAIDAAAQTDVEGGLMNGAAPTRNSNVIATFGLLWVGMLDDWRMQQRDPAPIVRNIPRMRRVIDWFSAWKQPSGLLGKNPQWNFIDWVGQASTDRTEFPSYGQTNESCLLSVIWLGALQQGSRVEAAYGDAAQGRRYATGAEALKQAIVQRCWSAERKLFADNPSKDRFSQHMNALAVLYDVVDQQQARDIMGRIVASGKGIDAPDGITPVSYYFAWYLAQAQVHAGLADSYHGLLGTWRGLLASNYTTWPEERDITGTRSASTRSDSHAWSAHPTADLLGIVAGIGPDAPGYKRLKVEPALGALRSVDATAATPDGPVTVSYRIMGDKLTATVTRPAKLPGDFVWNGQRHPLKRTRTKLVLDVR